MSALISKSLPEIKNGLERLFGPAELGFSPRCWVWRIPVYIDRDTTDLGIEIVTSENELGESLYEIGIFRIGPEADWETLSFGTVIHKEGGYAWLEKPGYPDWSSGWAPTVGEQAEVYVLIWKIENIFSIL